MNKNYSYKILLLTVLSVMLITCVKYKKNPVGSDYFNEDEMGDEKSCIIYSAPSDTFFKNINIKTGISPFLNIGAVQNPNISAKSLIKFKTYTDTTQIDSASLTLYIHKFYGQNNGIFSCSIYEVAKQWDDDSLCVQNYESGFQGEYIKDFTVSLNDTIKSLSVSLPSALIQSWLDSTTAENNYGLLFVPNNTQFITEFYSSKADSNQPALEIFTTTEPDTAGNVYPSQIVAPTDDIFIPEGEFEPTSDHLFISNGLSLRVLMYFDVSEIPEQATINKAFLTVYSDTLSAFPDNQETFTVSIFHTLNQNWTLPDVQIDSVTYSSIPIKSDSASADLTSSVQNWTSNMIKNNGLLLMGRNEYMNLDYRKLYSSAADTSKKPSLKIFYSIPPEENLNN